MSTIFKLHVELAFRGAKGLAVDDIIKIKATVNSEENSVETEFTVSINHWAFFDNCHVI